MKILEIANVDFSLRHFLLPLMRVLRDRGHEVIGACADGPLVEVARNEGFRVEPLPMARSLSPLAQWRALRATIALIRAERPDLVHAHMPISGFIARLAARLCGVPVVAYTCHGFLFNQPGRWPRRALGLGIEWIGGRLTDRYLTVSSEEAHDARRLRIHPRPVAIGNGRNPDLFRPDPEARSALRAEIGASETDIVIVVVSRLVAHKGYPDLLPAMQDVPGAQLWVVGDRLPSDHGAPLDALFDGAATQLGPRLKRLGYRNDIARILAAADIFTLPSHFEGLPMSVIEAMLTGLPVVATSIRGSRELVVNEETGLLVPRGARDRLAQALRRLAEDGPLRHAMGEAGRRRALTLFDEHVILNRTADLLERGCGRPDTGLRDSD